MATDIAARGIDVTGISHVINYDMPDTADAYIHRTGRTGRAACTGEALNFATNEDTRMIRTIEQSLDGKMQRQPVDPAVLASRHAEPDVRSDERKWNAGWQQSKNRIRFATSAQPIGRIRRFRFFRPIQIKNGLE